MFRRCPASLAPTLRRSWRRRATTLPRAALSAAGLAALLFGAGALLAACGQKGPLMRPGQTAGPSGGPATATPATPSSTAASAAPPAAASSVTR